MNKSDMKCPNGHGYRYVMRDGDRRCIDCGADLVPESQTGISDYGGVS